jgi:type I restriction enzyme R subunit
MPRNEAETRSQLINPAIQQLGWVWPLVREEVSAKRIDIIDGQPVVSKLGRVDYLLQVQVHRDTQPVPVAILEAKSEDHTPGHGLEQAKLYAECDRLNVPLVLSSNGHQWVSFDRTTQVTSVAKPMSVFPTPADLRALYEAVVGFSLEDPAARPLITPYKTNAGTPRYYQDVAVRAVFEKVARCERRGQVKRALLSLATGAGKTFIATALLRRLADAGQLRRALFVCDRTELRTQALGALQRAFGNDAAQVEEDIEAKGLEVTAAVAKLRQLLISE